jgi:lambda repressor-like predicted transcriptional regulator
LHPENIKAELRKRFGTVKAFEELKELPVDSVRDVLRGRSARRTAEAIAECLGKDVTSLFPGRFTDAPDTTSHKRDAHRLNQQAV